AHSALADQLLDLEAAGDHLADQRVAGRTGAEAEVRIACRCDRQRGTAENADLRGARRERAGTARTIRWRGYFLPGGHVPPGARSLAQKRGFYQPEQIVLVPVLVAGGSCRCACSFVVPGTGAGASARSERPPERA